ncbi:protein boule-like [Clytia hemisphaerica]|uniref:Boule-like 1d n=1 Tax=Clytia hemisphaerica TaxID=252671 RepID=A0A0P0ED46_9CNID|nr:boule-like 1d [Clytia hemisphaerica]|eukprot:TCONS_00008986-protein
MSYSTSSHKSSHHSSVMYGTHFPNRLFVGCLHGSITASMLGHYFYKFGPIIEAKVILDEHQQSRRFGFVTFAFAKDAEKTLKQKKFYLKGHRINVGPAIKKEHLLNVNMNSSTVKIVKPKQFERTSRYKYIFDEKNKQKYKELSPNAPSFTPCDSYYTTSTPIPNSTQGSIYPTPPCSPSNLIFKSPPNPPTIMSATLFPPVGTQTTAPASQHHMFMPNNIFVYPPPELVYF